MAEFAILPYEDYVDACNAVRERSDTTGKIVSGALGAAIRAIPSGGGADLSDVNARLDEINGEIIGAKTVTFMVEGKVYAVVEVAPGDTASRPANPTKASTVAEVFTFAGWSREDDGTVDSDALKNVTEDRTVYAVFTASPQYYTATFYDDDGTTFLGNERVAYGALPTFSLIPTGPKGYLFDGWAPALAPVTGDTSYTATYAPISTFAVAPMEEVAAVFAAGKGAEKYNVGDYRTMEIADVGTVEVVIIGFHHDDLEDGSGKAGATLMLKTVPETAITYYPGGNWISSVVRGGVEEYLEKLPEEWRALIKPVRKPTMSWYNNDTQVSANFVTNSLWPLSANEVGYTFADADMNVEGAVYPYFDVSSPTLRRTLYGINGDKWAWGLRTVDAKNRRTYVVSGSGSVEYRTSSPAYFNVHFGFCV